MGMFDSVTFDCPTCLCRGINSYIEVQSRAGECLLRCYHGDVPEAIAKDINGAAARCRHCGTGFLVEVVPKTVWTAKLR